MFLFPGRVTRAASIRCRPAFAGPLLAAIAVATLCASHARAEGTAIISGHPGWPPYTWQQGNTLTGIGVELAETVLRDIGATGKVVAIGNWARVQAETSAGNVDIVASIYATDDRRRTMLFPSPAYVEDTNVVWVGKGREFPFREWKDLVGKQGTAMRGESYGEDFDRFIRDHLTIDRVDKPEANLAKLVLGRADYYPFSVHGGRVQIRKYGYEGRIVQLPEVLSREGVYLAVSKKSKLAQRLPQIEEALRRRIADGTVSRLEQKYIALAAQQGD